MLTRRSMFFGAAALVAAPSIVRAGSLMPVKVKLLDFVDKPLWGTEITGSVTMLALQADANARMQALLDQYLGAMIERSRDVIERATIDRVLGFQGLFKVTGDGSCTYERITLDKP